MIKIVTKKTKIFFQSLFDFFKNKKIWIIMFIFFIFLSWFFYIWFIIKPSIYISPTLFTEEGKIFIWNCINSSKLSSTLTVNEKKQISDLIENIFFQMYKDGSPSQIGFKFYFYKFKYIIKLLYKVIEIKKNNADLIPNQRNQMISSRVVEELIYHSNKKPASKASKFIFYYFKK